MNTAKHSGMRGDPGHQDIECSKESISKTEDSKVILIGDIDCFCLCHTKQADIHLQPP